MRIFIPEKYLKHKEFLITLAGHGMGIEIEASQLGLFIKMGRIASEILPDNYIVLL